MQVSFTDMLRWYNARARVRLSDLGVRREVANFCLTVELFKEKNNLCLMYSILENYV